jgi:hypothetical protein
MMASECKSGFIVSDIDGTIRLFEKQKWSCNRRSPAFGNYLLHLPVLPWIEDIGRRAFSKARTIIFVTGGDVYLNDVNQQWLSENLDIVKAWIVNVPFVNHEQYVNDKERDLETCITECIKNRASRFEMIHVIEDDPLLLEFLVAVACELDAVMVHAISPEGKHSIRYPAMFIPRRKTVEVVT